MKDYEPTEGKLVPIYPGVFDRQQLREGCGSFTKVCNLSVQAILAGEGEKPRHSICTFDDGNDIRPMCGAPGLYPPKSQF